MSVPKRMGSVGDGKKSVTSFKTFDADIFMEPICDFLWQEGKLHFFSTLGWLIKS